MSFNLPLFTSQQYLLLAFITLCVLSLPACVSVTPVIPVEDADLAWKTRSEYLYQQNHWTAHLALIGANHQQKFKTRAVWEQHGDHYTIKLRDFIGRTIAIIEGSPQGVQAKTSKGQHYTGHNAEDLIAQLFDIQIPVSGMRYWLLGLPKPNVQVNQLVLNNAGLADQVTQEGWSMTYPYYLDNDPFKMPSQILLAFEDIDLTVKVSQWTFNTK